MSGLLSVLLVLAVVYVVRKLWKYLSTTSQNAPNRTEDAEDVIPSRELEIRKAIQDGYRSEAYPSLETIKPTDTLDEESIYDLPEEEQDILYFKRVWLSSKHPAQLASIIDRVIKDREGSPITNAVVLGVGGDDPQYFVHQFVIFSQIAAQLSKAYPGLLDNIVMQDPSMTAGWRALFENHGCQIAEDPAAFKFVGPNTLLYSPWCMTIPLLERLEEQPFGEIPMFVGNGKSLKRAIPNESSNQALFRRVLDPMFDDGFCRVEDVPCDKNETFPERPRSGPMCGLNGMNIWWRPQGEDEKILMRFEAALDVGFEAGWDQFEKAYDAGFATRYGEVEQGKIARGFMASRFLGNNQRFVDYFRAWVAGALTDDEKYDAKFKRWLSFDNDPHYQDQKRTWHQYLKGDDKYRYNPLSGRYPRVTYPPELLI